MTTNPVGSNAEDTFGKCLRRRSLTLGALIVFGFGALAIHGHGADRSTVDREAFLSAVAEVETGGNARAVGRRGERGLYQFTRATWRRYTTRSFVDAHNPGIAHDIAVQHFNWLHDRLVANGREPTVNRLAAAWNSGLGRVLSGSVPRSTRDYARRVSNLAAIYRPPTPKASVPVFSVAATRPAPAAIPITASAPIRFSLGPAETVAPEVAMLETAPEPTDEITFTLGSPAAVSKPGAATSTTSGRRLFFATIGE